MPNLVSQTHTRREDKSVTSFSAESRDADATSHADPLPFSETYNSEDNVLQKIKRVNQKW